MTLHIKKMYKKTKKIIPRPELTWNQENATNYEYYSIQHHQEKVNEISCGFATGASRQSRHA